MQRNVHLLYLSCILSDTSLYSETKLLVQVSGGDEKAFRIIFDRYRKKIYSYTFHLTESMQSADDTVQEVFIKVWLERKNLPDISNFNAWIHTLARHTVFNTLKKLAREKENNARLQTQATPLQQTADTILLDKENQRMLGLALEQLTPQQLQVYRLSREAGLTQEQIATQLGISLNTVKSHMVSALHTIREYLDAHTLVLMLLLACI
ncbi:MAG: sigma-70 family RNA polymerase sigma factor [Chitinophagaceae bacterium]